MCGCERNRSGVDPSGEGVGDHRIGLGIRKDGAEIALIREVRDVGVGPYERVAFYSGVVAGTRDVGGAASDGREGAD